MGFRHLYCIPSTPKTWVINDATEIKIRKAFMFSPDNL